MKKLFLAIALICFVAFGAIGVQSLMASSVSVEMVNLDKDPKKDSNKKSKDTKESTEVKAETSATSTSKDGCCTSSCSSKSSDACCSKDKEGCSKECPEKK